VLKNENGSLKRIKENTWKFNLKYVKYIKKWGSLICWPRYGAERSGEHVSLGLVKKESLNRIEIENLSIFSTHWGEKG